MKKSLLCVLVMVVSISLVLTFSFAGCKAEAVEEVAEEAPVEEEVVEEEAAPAEPVNLVMWVGGMWEFPDAPYFEWFEDMAVEYNKLNPNITIEMVPLSDETYFTETIAAAEAKSDVDISYCWPGVFTMQYIWKGYFEPLNNWIPMEELNNVYGLDQRLFGGNYYGYPFYVAGKPMFYNKAILRESGVEEEELQNWDTFIAACEKIKEAGYVPVATGGGDGWYGGYHLGDFGSQTLNESELMEMSIGEKSFTSESFLIIWEKLYELVEKEYLSPDVASLGLFPAWETFGRGEAAVVFAADAMASSYLDALGEDLGVAVMPAYGDASYVFEAQGAVMTSWSDNKKEAADFLMWLHTPDIMADCFNKTGTIFPHKKFDSSLLEGQPVLEFVWDNVSSEKYAPWMENYWPVMVDEQAAFALTPGFLQGNVTPMEFCETCDEIATKWAESNPEELAKFKEWMKDYE